MGVGGYLQEHASGLGAALTTVTDVALSLHNRSQDSACDRRRGAFKFPPIEVDEMIMFSRPAKDGSGEEHVGFRLHVIAPGFLTEEGKALEFKRFVVTSSFEASIQKHYDIKNETEIGIHGKVGILAALSGVGIDVTNKLTAEFGGEDKQHNTFDTDMELGTGEPPMAYKMICKIILRAVDKVVERAMNEGLSNPRLMTDDEVKALSDKAKTSVKDHNIAAEQDAEKKEESSSADSGQGDPSAETPEPTEDSGGENS